MGNSIEFDYLSLMKSVATFKLVSGETITGKVIQVMENHIAVMNNGDKIIINKLHIILINNIHKE